MTEDMNMTTEEIRQIVKDELEPTKAKVCEIHTLLVKNGFIATVATHGAWLKALKWAMGGMGLVILALIAALLAR